MVNRRFSRMGRRPRSRTRKLFWVRYTGVNNGTGSVPFGVTLLDPLNFEPSSTATYATDINREVTLHRLKLNYTAEVASPTNTAATGLIDLFFGIVKSDASTPSPSVGTVADQRRDWLDLWMDGCPAPASGASNVAFNAGEMVHFGAGAHDVKTKRTLESSSDFIRFCGVAFNHTGTALPSDTIVLVQYQVSMLVSRAT